MLTSHRTIQRTLRWHLWGVVLAGMANAALWEQGYHVLQSGTLLLAAASLVAVMAGASTPDTPSFTSVVLALSTPLVFAHAPVAVGLIPLYAIASLLLSPTALPPFSEVISGLLGSAALLGYNLAFTYGPYWIPVRMGYELRQSLSRRS